MGSHPGFEQILGIGKLFWKTAMAMLVLAAILFLGAVAGVSALVCHFLF